MKKIFSVFLSAILALCIGTAAASADDDFRLTAVGESTLTVQNSSYQIQMEVSPSGAIGTVSYCWYRADAFGMPVNNTVIGTERTLTIDPIPAEEENIPRYYLCKAVDNGREADASVATATFTVILKAEDLSSDFLLSYGSDIQYTLKTANGGSDGSCSFKVIPSGFSGEESEIVYHWYQTNSDGVVISTDASGNRIDLGDGTDSYTVKGVPAGLDGVSQYFVCEATDASGAEATCYFSCVLLLRELTVTAEKNEIEISTGEKSVTLEITEVENAHGTVSYLWYKCDQNGLITELDKYGSGKIYSYESSFTADTSGMAENDNAYYLCTVSDDYSFKDTVFRIYAVPAAKTEDEEEKTSSGSAVSKDTTGSAITEADTDKDNQDSKKNSTSDNAESRRFKLIIVVLATAIIVLTTILISTRPKKKRR